MYLYTIQFFVIQYSMYVWSSVTWKAKYPLMKESPDESLTLFRRPISRESILLLDNVGAI